MRRCTLIILLAALSLGIAAAEAPDEDPLAGGMRFEGAYVSILDGEVHLQRRTATDWELLTLNAPIGEGDRLISGTLGRGEIHVDWWRRLRFWAQTKLDLRALRKEDDGIHLAASLMLGSYHFRAVPAETELTAELSTPSAFISVRGAVSLRIDVEQDGTTWVTVEAGACEVESAHETKIVGMGYRTRCRPGEPPEEPWLFDRDDTDNFDLWIAELDREWLETEEEAPGDAGAPPGAYSELSRYGSWVVIPGYGWCWYPADVPPGWAPYFYGYWYYTSPWGWFWISSDPWGWYPYHYGSWFWHPVYGWVWVPGPYWGPAWVWWFYDDDYIYWTPRHPHDRYRRVRWEGKRPINATLEQARALFQLPRAGMRGEGAPPVERVSWSELRGRAPRFQDHPLRRAAWLRPLEELAARTRRALRTPLEPVPPMFGSEGHGAPLRRSAPPTLQQSPARQAPRVAPVVPRPPAAKGGRAAPRPPVTAPGQPSRPPAQPPQQVEQAPGSQPELDQAAPDARN
jgi:hypothetical protein